MYRNVGRDTYRVRVQSARSPSLITGCMGIVCIIMHWDQHDINIHMQWYKNSNWKRSSIDIFLLILTLSRARFKNVYKYNLSPLESLDKDWPLFFSGMSEGNYGIYIDPKQKYLEVSHQNSNNINTIKTNPHSTYIPSCLSLPRLDAAIFRVLRSWFPYRPPQSNQPNLSHIPDLPVPNLSTSLFPGHILLKPHLVILIQHILLHAVFRFLDPQTKQTDH